MTIRNKPGSKSAYRRGCTCPQMDNNYGKGITLLSGEPIYWIDGDCPLHGMDHIEEDEDAELDKYLLQKS